jgi:hypothetical protein
MTPEERAQMILEEASDLISVHTDTPQSKRWLIEIVAEQIGKAIAEAAPRWIPVGERLPDYDPNSDNLYAVVWYPMLGGPPHRGEALRTGLSCYPCHSPYLSRHSS